MSESTFTNIDYNLVRIHFETKGTENMLIYRGNYDKLKGPSNGEFRFAWKSRNEVITQDEFDTYAVTGYYGTDYEFGTPSGRIP